MFGFLVIFFLVRVSVAIVLALVFRFARSVALI